MASRLSLVLLAVFALPLGGCATSTFQSAVPMQPGALSIGGGRIGVAMSAIPVPSTQPIGADQGLACLAMMNIENGSLTNYAKSLPTTALATLPAELAALLAASGAKPVVLPGEFTVTKLEPSKMKGRNVALRDFSALASQYAIDKLLVVDIKRLGFDRFYDRCRARTDPRAALEGLAYIVNLSNNTYEWFEGISHDQAPPGGTWDNPPSYPELTKGYLEVVEAGRQEILKPFRR